MRSQPRTEPPAAPPPSHISSDPNLPPTKRIPLAKHPGLSIAPHPSSPAPLPLHEAASGCRNSPFGADIFPPLSSYLHRLPFIPPSPYPPLKAHGPSSPELLPYRPLLTPAGRRLTAPLPHTAPRSPPHPPLPTPQQPGGAAPGGIPASETSQLRDRNGNGGDGDTKRGDAETGDTGGPARTESPQQQRRHLEALRSPEVPVTHFRSPAPRPAPPPGALLTQR